MVSKKYEEIKQNANKAKAKYNKTWWESNDPEVIFLGQIKEEVLLMEFDKFHKAAEEALGRPVYTHEFANTEELLDEFFGKTPKATMENIMSKLERYGKPIIAIGI